MSKVWQNLTKNKNKKMLKNLVELALEKQENLLKKSQIFLLNF